MIDLHTHSTYSDGSLTPAQLAAHASETGLTAIALTDHDCLEGVREFLDACANAGAGEDGKSSLMGIPGVEISVRVAAGAMHILGYFVDDADAAFGDILRRIRGGRDDRNKQIVTRLVELGCDLTMEDVRRCAGDLVVGRPHFALAMIRKGYVGSKKEAFEKYLVKGGPAYVDRYRLSPEESIAAISRAGGVSVLAHPLTLGLDDKALRCRIGELKEMGLAGIEAYYSEHTADREREYIEMAREFGLLVTGGSDFHGALNPAIKLGRGFGSLRVPDSVAEKLYERSGKTPSH